MDEQTNTKIPLGVSSCLLGQAVRFDGGHKKNDYILKTLGEYFEFYALCPEVGAGLGIPRPTIRLTRTDATAPLRVVEVKQANQDHTAALTHYAQQVIPQLAQLSGYILKKDSPSCGMERVKVYRTDNTNAPPQRDGVGVFARILQQHYPNLPVEEEGRLSDPVLRENFIERVFVYQRWQQLERTTLTPAKLVDFHSTHKYSIMAHDQNALRKLGQMVAQAGKTDDFQALCQNYIQYLMQVMSIKVKRGQHTNVLQHLMGYVSDSLDTDDRAELTQLIEQYRLGYVPLVVPLTLLNHHFRRHPNPYIGRQYYLNPHPAELMLRNTV